MRRHILLCATSLILLTSCVSSVEQLRKSDLKGNSFQIELAKQYLDFAEKEADDYDWFDSAHFARKGLKLVAGQDAPPEDLKSWDLPDDTAPILAQAREYLVKVITPDVTKKFPIESATAQFMFDCWVEQQEENWQTADIAKCRDGFYTTLDKLFAITTKGADLAPEKPSATGDAKTIEATKQETKVAYFKTGSAELSDNTKRLVSTFISHLKDIKNYEITLNGYADMVGSEDYNMKLSKKRALAIKKALVDGGLDEKSITLLAFGNTQGRVKAEKNVPSQENRAVEVVLDIK